MKLFYALMRDKHTKKTFVIPYYDGLSVFPNAALAKRRIRSYGRKKLVPVSYAKTRNRDICDFRVLPWHTEMGEADIQEMWRSALDVGGL